VAGKGSEEAPSLSLFGFIANTDFGWFSHFLHRAEPPDEVDFWQLSPHGFKAIPAGAPFFFRLGAPHKAIAGYGFFARYERVPVWLAWESFGDLNGTDTFAEMTARIEAIRRRTGSRPRRGGSTLANHRPQALGAVRPRQYARMGTA